VPTAIKAARGPRPRPACATGGHTTVTTGPTASVRPVGRGVRPAHSARRGRTSMALGTLDASGGAGHGRLGRPGARTKR
jgi:hypothetical protein